MEKALSGLFVVGLALMIGLVGLLVDDSTVGRAHGWSLKKNPHSPVLISPGSAGVPYPRVSSSETELAGGFLRVRLPLSPYPM